MTGSIEIRPKKEKEVSIRQQTKKVVNGQDRGSTFSSATICGVSTRQCTPHRTRGPDGDKSQS